MTSHIDRDNFGSTKVFATGGVYPVQTKPYHVTIQGVKVCLEHDERFGEGEDCPECIAAEKAKAKDDYLKSHAETVKRLRDYVRDLKRILPYCETHDETFVTQCPQCAMWKANILDQDAQEITTMPEALDPVALGGVLGARDTVEVILPLEKNGERIGVRAEVSEPEAQTPPAFLQSDADGWFAWHGGECSLHPHTIVEFKMRSITGAQECNAGALDWKHIGRESDIVAFRVVRKAPSESPKPNAPSEPQSGGVKFDQNKPPVSLVDRHAIEQIANVLAFGAKKYAAHNWRQGIAYSRLLDAALRHLFAFADGEDNDPESGLSHIAHAGCCVVFLLGMIETKPELDDRFKGAK